VKVLFFLGINFRGLVKSYQFRGFCVCTQNKICWFYIFNIISFTGFQNFEKASIHLNKWAVELCYRKLNVHINVFTFSFFFFYIYQLGIGTKSALNFIVIDQCKSVLFYRIWKLKKNHLKLFYEHIHFQFPSIYIKFVFMFYKYLISILFSIFVFHN
jgi:hypothetical protein